MNITIGLPKALYYYKYNILWKNFFNYLNIKTITSINTNKEIINNGKEKINDEACFSMKIYLGHIDYLKDKCDYILIPRIFSLNKYEKMCTNFNCSYDLVNNTFKNIKILNYNIDMNKNITEEKAFIKMGKKLGLKTKKIKEAYLYAKEKERLYYKEKLSIQDKNINSNKIKILLVGHAYNIFDNYIGKDIIDFLEKNNTQVIYSNYYLDKVKDYKEISKTLYWTYSKELINSIIRYKDKVNGIILLSTFPCGLDSLVNEIILRIIDTPIINIIYDELNSNGGLYTRLESFIDILEERKTIHE